MKINKEKVAIVILNYNGAGYLKKFLPLLVRHTEGARIVVADNASTDNSEAVCAEFFGVEWLMLGKNFGFCGGYNRALRQIKASYYLLLNSDIAVTAGWLTPLVELLDSQPTVAVCQPKILDYNKKDTFEYAGAAGGYLDFLGYPFARGRVFQTLEKDEGQYDTTASIFWASGACMLIRATLYHRFGGFDERFFAHMEEIDLCWRLKTAGYQIKCTPAAKVYHIGGGTLHKTNPKKTFFNFRNSLLVLLKNLPSVQLIPVIFTRLVLDGLAIAQFLTKTEWANALAVVQSHFAFYALMPKIIRERKNTSSKKINFSEVYKKSIVWAYFVKKKKKFSDLHLNTA